MTRTYTQIQKEIAALTREADRVKQEEVQGVIARIKQAIAEYGITEADLGLGRRTKMGTAKSAGRRAAKFRDGAGNAWGGRGPRPQWLRDALAAGQRLEDFAV